MNTMTSASAVMFRRTSSSGPANRPIRWLIPAVDTLINVARTHDDEEHEGGQRERHAPVERVGAAAPQDRAAAPAACGNAGLKGRHCLEQAAARAFPHSGVRDRDGLRDHRAVGLATSMAASWLASWPTAALIAATSPPVPGLGGASTNRKERASGALRPEKATACLALKHHFAGSVLVKPLDIQVDRGIRRQGYRASAAIDGAAWQPLAEFLDQHPAQHRGKRLAPPVVGHHGKAIVL